MPGKASDKEEEQQQQNIYLNFHSLNSSLQISVFLISFITFVCKQLCVCVFGALQKDIDFSQFISWCKTALHSIPFE